jgi:hypothetical protein
MPSKYRTPSFTWEYCATASEATQLAEIAQQVIGMEVRRNSLSPAAFGPHSECAAAGIGEGTGRTPTQLVTISYEAHPRAAGTVKLLLAAVVSSCLLHR